jgi:hypothetical protein
LAQALFDFNSSPYPWFIWTGLALTLLMWRYLSVSRAGTKRIFEVLARANRELGTTFPEDGNSRPEFMLGPFAHPNTYCLIFDVERRKIAVSYLGHSEVHDFDYIRTWDLRWIEKSIDGHVSESKPHLLLGTSGVQRPTLTVQLRSMREGHDRNQRLALLLDERAA